MTDKTKGHSPLPWRIPASGSILGLDEVTSADGKRCAFSPGGSLGTPVAYANAALIIREVNEAPKLREEVERLRALVRDAARLIGKPPASSQYTPPDAWDAWYVKQMPLRQVQRFHAARKSQEKTSAPPIPK